MIIIRVTFCNNCTSELTVNKTCEQLSETILMENGHQGRSKRIPSIVISCDGEEEPKITGNITDGEETTPRGRSNLPPSISSQELCKSTLSLSNVISLDDESLMRSRSNSTSSLSTNVSPSTANEDHVHASSPTDTKTIVVLPSVNVQRRKSKSKAPSGTNKSQASEINENCDENLEKTTHLEVKAKKTNGNSVMNKGFSDDFQKIFISLKQKL